MLAALGTDVRKASTLWKSEGDQVQEALRLNSMILRIATCFWDDG